MKLIAALLLLTQVAGIIRDGAAEILFPQAIRFTLNLEIPAADIQQARLMIMPAGRAPITFDVVPAEALVNANATAEVTAEISSAAAAEATMDVDTAPTQLTVMWRLSADDPPTLFSPIRYTWTVTTADGDATFEDTFVFADPNIDWARSIDPASGVSVSTVPALAGMVDSLRQVYDLLIDNVPDLPPGLVLYHFPFGCEVTDEGLQTRRIGENGMTVPCDPSIDEAVFAGYRPLVISSGLRTIDGVIDTVVRQLYADPWSNKSVPDWFQRGLAQFYTPVFKNALLVPVQQAARGRTLLSLDQMRVFDEAALWNAQSYAMVLYIVDQIGVEGLFALARVDAPNFESAYRSAVGHPVTALIPALEQWVFTRAADAAYGITPYQAPTAIPTATPLLTDTPTITPLPTATPTITPTTETPRLMRTYPPAPTVTPSETFTPLPPTITPRPPGSLTDPTPIPPPLQESLQAALTQPGVQISVVTFLLLLLGLLVLLFIRVGNRR